MRRVLATVAVVLAAMGAAIAVVGNGAEADSTYRVDVIFDTAKGLIPGQLVKIAGAETGEILDVVLTPDYKARVQMTVEQQFAPFRSDARCDIQPEGLIGENFVQCTPGTPKGEELRGIGGEAPTVPVENTTVPVTFTDLFDIFTVPVRDRLRLVLAGLGGGVAARGDELNEILLRANPALRQVRRLTTILDDQRDQLATAVEATDDVVAELADRRTGIGDLVEQGARLSRRTARREGDLRETVRRLPPLLDAARPALERLDELAASGTPTLRDLRLAAPQIERVVRDLRPFSIAARPAIESVGDVSVVGRRVARGDAREVIDLARIVALGGREPIGLLTDLLVDLRDRGGVEHLLRYLYNFTAASARYDSISHILPAHLISTGCEAFATTPTPGCSAKFTDAAPPAQARTRRETRPEPRRERPAPTAPERSESPAPAPERPKPDPLGIERLLEDVVPLLPDLPNPDRLVPRPDLGPLAPRRPSDPRSDESLLEFLLG